MNKSGHDHKKEQGVALVITLLFLVGLGLLSTALVLTVQAEMKTSVSYKYSQQAFHVANAGMQKSVQWFVNSYTPHLPASDYDATTLPVQYSGRSVLLAGQTGSTSAYPESGVITSFSNAFGNQSLQANTNNSGVYALNATLSKYTTTTFLNPATFLSYAAALERWKINSAGYWGSSTRPLGVSQVDGMIENSGNAVFDRAIWGINSVSLSGSVSIDSYDPALGPYGGSNVGSLGAIGSNGSVSTNGNVTVQGDLAYGQGGSYTHVGGGIVTGTVTQLATPHYFPPIPSFSVGTTNYNVSKKTQTLSPGSYGNITIGTSGIVSLHPGTYYINQITEGSTATLKILNEPGTTTIFVKTSLNLSGLGVLNLGGDPTKLTIVYAGTSEFKMAGGTGFYGQVYGPNATFNFAGDSNFYGSFIAKAVIDSGNPDIHFDEGCLRENLIQRPFRLVTWSQSTY